MGAGAALGAGALAFVILERSAVSDFNQTCARGCPAERFGDGSAIHDRAVLDRNLSIGLGIGAGVFVGVGAYLLLTKSSGPGTTNSSALIAPGAPGAPAGVSLHGWF